MSSKAVYKFATDLGAAAFLMMHKYKVVGKRGRAIYFEVNESEIDEFESLQVEYLSTEFHRFDTCLLSLKKIAEYMPRDS